MSATVCLTVTTMTKKRGKKRKKKKRTARAVMAQAREFVVQIQRLEREHIPIMPEHPPLH